MPDTSNNSDLLKKEIDSMHLRKQTLLASLGNDIAELEKQRDIVAVSVGYLMYNANKEEKGEPKDALAPLYEEMKNIENEIDSKKTKMSDISARYDEEIDILLKSINLPSSAPATITPPKPPVTPTPAAPSASAAVLFCEECGAKYTDGETKFCETCGTKLN